MTRNGAPVHQRRHHNLENPDNPDAYASVAEQDSETVGVVDCPVGPVGSGGSTGGTAAFPRLLQQWMRLIGVDTPPSATFRQAGGSQVVRGIGNSLVPPDVGHDAYDEVHRAGPAEVFRATCEPHALYKGSTSGASFLVARWYAERHPNAQGSAFLPDEGHRYQEPVYWDEWLTEQGQGLLGDPPAALPDPPPHVTATVLTGTQGVPAARHHHRCRVGHAVATAPDAPTAAHAGITGPRLDAGPPRTNPVFFTVDGDLTSHTTDSLSKTVIADVLATAPGARW
ncbi:hypothetical protein [Streptomyces sp. NPDC126522]|uniref:hypothetical protein n=1 Tax=Streptomyces sp. NPDC126522 TaxID=3155211 RepID=UPI0033342485